MAPVDLIIVGASARAAGESARRAGFHPWCGDLFRDADLARWAPGRRCPFESYPQQFASLLEEAPQVPWIYTGGLENHPDLIERLSQLRPLWGNTAATLRAIRSPFRLAQMLEEGGFKPLRVETTVPGNQAGRWLCKPLRGSAGNGISWEASDKAEQYYWQEFAEGPSWSAQYVACRGEVILLGVTEQLVATPWLHARPFQYAGNLGPLAISKRLEDQLVEVARHLVAETGLIGLFGIDFILQEDRARIVEVNPRYTAAMEVLERASGLYALAWHSAAFDSRASLPATATRTEAIQGKAILYAQKPVTMSNELTSYCLSRPERFADVPHGGECIEAGWPIMTLFAQGKTRSECEIHLQQAVAKIEATFSSASEGTPSSQPGDRY